MKFYQKKIEMTAPYTRFCATLNNPTDETKSYLMDTHKENFIRFVCTEEVGANGTPHLQIAGCTKKQIRLRALQKLLSPTQKAHVERQKGSNEDNLKYCCKDKDKSDFHICFGDWTVKSGSRYSTEDMIRLHEMNHGGDDNYTHEDCLFCRYV